MLFEDRVITLEFKNKSTFEGDILKNVKDMFNLKGKIS
jgi:hypothetical protein